MQNNPYIGPRPFERHDRDKFYGRARETRDLLALILAERVVLFYAQSGAGKTSLLNTQIVPALEEEGFKVLPIARVGSDAPRGLDAASVKNIFVLNALLALAGPQGEVSELGAHTLQSFLAPFSDEEHPPIIIFDQFEEIFITHRDRWEDAHGFFEQLRDALQALPQLGVILALREDFVAGLDPYAALLPKRLKTRFRMERLGYAGALEAIKQPAAKAGVPFAPDVAEQLVDDLRRIKAAQFGGAGQNVLGPYVEPVQLQVVCSQLWERLPEQADQRIDEEDVRKYGNVDLALTGFYERCVELAGAAASVRESDLRHWFTDQLITPMQTRGLVLRGDQVTAGLSNAAVDRFESTHIISSDVRAGVRWYEISHDRLVDPIIQSNRAWEQARMTPLRATAQNWRQSQNADLLYGGLALVEAQQWAHTHPTDVEDYEQEFLEASVQRQRIKTRSRTVRLTATAILAFALLLMTGLAVIALNATHELQRETIRSRSGQLAAQSQVALSRQQPQRSLLLALEALTVTQRASEPLVPAARQALLDALHGIDGRGVALHTSPIVNMALSADGHWLATADEDQHARLWDLRTSEPTASPLVLPNQIDRVSISPNGRWLATSGADPSVRLWDLQSTNPLSALIVLEGQASTANELIFSPDNRWLVTSDRDYALRLWDLASQKRAPAFTRLLHNPAVPLLLVGGRPTLGLAISPDSRWLASRGGDPQDNNLHLWDLRAADPTARSLDLPNIEPADTFFSPDGQWLAAGTSGLGSVTRLWPMTATLQALEAHTPLPQARVVVSDVVTLAFSPDKRWLALGGSDNGIGLVNLADPTGVVKTLKGHTDSISSLSFSPDGRWLTSSSYDDTSRVWDMSVDILGDPTQAVPVRVLEAHEKSIIASAITADNQLVTASWDGTARQWDLQTTTAHAQPTRVADPAGQITRFAVSGDSRWLATASDDVTVSLRSLQTLSNSTTVPLLPLTNASLTALAASPDGHWLAAGSTDNLARLYDLRSADPGHSGSELKGHTGAVNSLTFSPDGHWLLTASADNTTRLWDLTTASAASSRELTRGDAPLTSGVFSPDDRWLVTLGSSSLPRLWNLQAAEPVSVPIELDLSNGHSVSSAAFSSDGKRLLVGIDDGRAYLEELSSNGLTGQPQVFHESETPIDMVAFSQNDRWAVIAHSIPGFVDGQSVGSYTGSGVSYLWDWREPQRPPVSLAQGPMAHATLSPDGRWLLIDSDVMRLWDLTAPDPSGTAITLAGNSRGQAQDVAFSPDGRWLFVQGEDLQAWSLRPEELGPLACHTAGRNFTPSEWAQYFSGKPYRKTCEQLPVVK